MMAFDHSLFHSYAIERFKNVVEIIMNNDSALIRNALINKLTASDQRHQTVTGREHAPSEPQTALKAETDKQAKWRRRNPAATTISCFNCGKRGHMSRNCRSKRKNDQSASQAEVFLFSACADGTRQTNANRTTT